MDPQGFEGQGLAMIEENLRENEAMPQDTTTTMWPRIGRYRRCWIYALLLTSLQIQDRLALVELLRQWSRIGSEGSIVLDLSQPRICKTWMRAASLTELLRLAAALGTRCFCIENRWQVHVVPITCFCVWEVLDVGFYSLSATFRAAEQDLR